MDLELLEALALADDRSAALAQLLPGSEDHDFYRALAAQHRGAHAEADAIIAAWPERHGGTPRYARLQLRQLLYRVTATPPSATEQLRDWLGVNHWHEAEVEDVDPTRPSRLADAAFDGAALLRQATEHDANLSQVSDEGLAELVTWQLDDARRRVLLSRLGPTAQPEVVALIADELALRGAAGFGTLAIHHQLTLEQLHALAQRRPELRSHAGWVAAVVTRMRPPAEVDLELDAEARATYLEELWQLVAGLPPASNSLKAHVLWHLLDTARRRPPARVEPWAAEAAIDRDLVRGYLALPRSAGYLAHRWIDQVKRDEVAQLGADFAGVTGLPPAGSDEDLVRDLVHAAGDDAQGYAAWLDRGWLDAEIATARLLAGDRNLDRATITLGPARAQALRDRIELRWCAHNRTQWAADAPVALDVDVKHVGELVIKVFRIDPVAYFQHHHREVDASLDLDGLAASHEEVRRFPEPASRRVRRRIELPACTRPGSYVIDLIGNGTSSRAVIHKGRLRHLVRVGAAGHVITILDEDGRPRPDAQVWLGDRAYAPDARGAVVVAFSTHPGRTALLLTAGELATVAYVELVAEAPALRLALALDRQALTAGRTARAIARLALTVGGAPASLALLQQPSWDVTLTDRHGVATTRSQPLALSDGDAAVLEWPLGDDTAAIAITVRGRIEVRTTQREEMLEVARRFRVAEMYGGSTTEALYLARTATGWVMSALGKTGEPRARRTLTVGIVHRWAHTQLNVELATDELGRVELGPLPGARQLTATLGAQTQTWALDDPPTPGAAIHARAGDDVVIAIPASRAASDVLRRAVLVELRAQAPARAAAARLEPLDGAIAVRGLAAGSYELRAPGVAATPISVVAATAELAGWAITPARLVELPRPAPAIVTLAADDQAVTVRLGGGDARTRVHLIATRLVPAPLEVFAAARPTPALRFERRRGAAYVSGRELGDEYRYVLERRSAPRFPGLLLDKPSLLLNPWARRATTTEVAPPRPGGAFAAAPAAAMAQGYGAGRAPSQPAGPDDAFAGYDFLGEPPVVVANLVPDADGAVRVARGELGAATTVTVLVDDPAGASVRRLALPEAALAPRDLRLRLALDPARHASQHKAIRALGPSDALVIDDLATAKLHLIDSVERAHGYLLALRDDPALRELAFVTRWHTLADAERRALYSKYACHELHLFLHRKDRGFFDAVIRPYLAHKRVKTFIDHYLLDADLAPYTEPARLARCNAVERALLAQRLAGDPALPRLLADEVATQAPDPARDARLIDTLLGAAALDGDAEIGGMKAARLDEAEAEVDESMRMAAARPGPRGVSAAAAPPRAKLAEQRGARRERAKDEAGGDDAYFADDLARRDQAAPMFRPTDQTQEWAEHNWWRRTPAESGADMIAASRLWRDLAGHTGGRFLSPWLGLATGSFAEAMCALAVSDLPFVAPAHAIVADGPRLTITAAGDALAGSLQLVDGPLVGDGPPLVVGMSYVRADDRHDWIDGEQVDRYVSGPLSVGVVYTCQVVLANPTSARQRVAALVQIPRGSIAVDGARPTHTIDVALPPYGTHGHEVSFYFPAPGAWSHFPVHVSRGPQIVAAAPGRTLEVQAGSAALDPRSWPQLSQRGALAEVTSYLATANLAATELSRVAWRLREPGGYAAILGALEARRGFDPTLWAYALLHNDPPRIRTWLRARADELSVAGPVLDMLDLDAEALGAYEHTELAPLVNARAHRLGPALRILHPGLAAQYARFLDLVAHRRAPTVEDWLAAAHYLLAQDRVAPALAALARVDPAGLADRMQHDYLAGYAACLTGDLAAARGVAARWRDHPVDRWRHRFAALAGMLDELAGAAPTPSDPRSRDQQQAELAARQPAFDLAVDRDGVVVRSRNVAGLELRYFEMDIELLFSRQPFVHSDVSRFSFIEPGHRQAITDPPPEHRLAWPAELRGKNVVVEGVGAGLRVARVHYANDLATHLAHQYGQLRVQRAADARPLPATYVKVYARQRGGAVAFYKDGYTDLRGWFDYASLSSDGLDAVERFAILVCSDQAGAAILEVAPPAR
jgi:hypothetical protein